jgi:hypothetical protein
VLGIKETAYAAFCRACPQHRGIVIMTQDDLSVDRVGQLAEDLSGLGNQEALAKLPADEREACQKLWADVESRRCERRFKRSPN